MTNDKRPKSVPKGAKPVARITVYAMPKKGKEAATRPPPRPSARKR